MQYPRLKILVFVGYYIPGYKGGGPLRALVNMVAKIGGEFDFKIFTSDRDLQEKHPYPGVCIDNWNKVGQSRVFYSSLKSRSFRGIRKILFFAHPDILYLNSFFSPDFTIKPLLLRRLRLIPRMPVIMAVRGEFSPAALSIKWLKKMVYILISKVLGLYDGVIWQASSGYEEKYIRRWFGKKVAVEIVADLPPSLSFLSIDPALKHKKAENSLKMVFLSRISRMKNLDGALKILHGVKGQIYFNIYGPVEDNRYWMECLKIIRTLPRNIEVNYCGNLPHEQVLDLLGTHDLFFLPTLGENFGHVIIESLCAGCPVLISDKTPWRGLAKKGVGWDLPLDQIGLFRDIIHQCINMDHLQQMELSERARAYGLGVVTDETLVKRNRSLFYNTMHIIRM